jgi:hypothetical protein
MREQKLSTQDSQLRTNFVEELENAAHAAL